MNKLAVSKPKSISPSSQSKEVLDAIRHIVRALRLSARESEAQVGLSGAQLFVLQKLADGKRVALSELAARTLTDASSVSVVVSRLVEKGLISRERSTVDARRAEIRITAEGRLVLRRSPGVAQDRLIAALDRMKPTQRTVLSQLLRHLIAEMGLDNARAPLFFEEEARKEDVDGSRSR